MKELVTHLLVFQMSGEMYCIKSLIHIPFTSSMIFIMKTHWRILPILTMELSIWKKKRIWKLLKIRSDILLKNVILFRYISLVRCITAMFRWKTGYLFRIN